MNIKKLIGATALFVVGTLLSACTTSVGGQGGYSNQQAGYDGSYAGGGTTTTRVQVGTRMKDVSTTETRHQRFDGNQFQQALQFAEGKHNVRFFACKSGEDGAMCMSRDPYDRDGIVRFMSARPRDLAEAQAKGLPASLLQFCGGVWVQWDEVVITQVPEPIYEDRVVQQAPPPQQVQGGPRYVVNFGFQPTVGVGLAQGCETGGVVLRQTRGRAFYPQQPSYPPRRGNGGTRLSVNQTTNVAVNNTNVNNTVIRNNGNNYGGWRPPTRPNRPWCPPRIRSSGNGSGLIFKGDQGGGNATPIRSGGGGRRGGRR